MMNLSKKCSLLISLFLPLFAALTDAKAQRIPIGIYAVVPVERVVSPLQTEGVTVSGINSYLLSFYAGLLNNPAVSGLTLQVHWDTLNPRHAQKANPYFWDYVDDAFSAVQAWNANHPSGVPKGVQLIVAAGFNSPQWMLNDLTSCDGLFYDPEVPPPSSCGKVTFTNFEEGGDSSELPLPWNTTYQGAWATFLQALAKQYNSNPSFVSIAVAGPTAASAEMLLPNGADATQTQFMAFGAMPISPNAMWKALLQLQYGDNPVYLATDQAFIDAWDHAIDTYGEIFSNVTLVATTGNGLPSFNTTKGPFPPPSAPVNFAPDCLYPENMDCQAETTILSYFVQSLVGGNNAKATQTSGLEASREGLGDLGIDGVRYLAQQTAGSTQPSQILGGAQFNQPFSTSSQAAETEGASPIREQALYNVLQDFFTGTFAADQYCVPLIESGASAPANMNYMQIYYQDIQYAGSHGPTSVAEGCWTISVSAQDLLNTASQQLLAIAER